MHIDLRKLRHAVTIADTSSFVHAAERLALTQSALTRSIQALEADMGLRLFDRDRGGVALTADGRQVIERARALLRDAGSLALLAGQLSGGDAGEVRIGLAPVPAAILLPDLLLRLRDALPDVRLAIKVQGAADLCAALIGEKLDLALCPQVLIGAGGDFTCDHLLRVAPVHVVRPGHPLALARAATAEDLAGFPLILNPPGARDPAELVGARVPIVLCDDFAALRALTLASDAIWLASDRAVRKDLEAGTLVAVATSEPAQSFDIAVVRLRGRTGSAAQRRAESLIRVLLIDGQPQL